MASELTRTPTRPLRSRDLNAATGDTMNHDPPQRSEKTVVVSGDIGVDELIDGAAAGGWLAQVGTGVRGLFTEAVARVDDVLSLSSEGRYELWKPNEAESDQRQLVERLDRAWERQAAINDSQARLAMLNTVMNVKSLKEAKALRSQVAMGKQAVLRLNQTVKDQVSKIVDLESHVSTLETDLATTRTEAQALRSDYESQRAMLSQHQQALERMQQRKFSHDAVTDTVILGVSMLASNLSLVNLPLNLIVAIVPRRRLRVFLRQALKVVLVWMLSRLLRHRASQVGLHNGVGTWASYTKWAVHSLRLTLTAAKKSSDGE